MGAREDDGVTRLLRPLPPWHLHGSTELFRLQGIDRSAIGAPALYLAASEGTVWNGDGSRVTLRADDWLGSGTLRNSFFVEPWARLSHARELALVIEAEGSLRVRVMRASLGRAAEVLREMHIDSPRRVRTTLMLGSLSALPENSRLFWHIDAIDGACVHDATWCTRDRPRESTGLAVLMRTFGRTGDLQALLAGFASSAQADPHHAECLARTEFWVLDASPGAEASWADSARLGLNLRVMAGPNLGGGGNASHLIHHFLVHCDAAADTAPGEVLILDDDLLLSMESLARYFAACSYRAQDHVSSLPVLMKSRPTQVWEDGGYWGRLNFRAQGGFGRQRNLFPHLLKHGLSLEGFEHLDDFGPLNPCEYATFIFFGLSLATLRRVGYPAAFFLRGDDIEYSLRAQALGVPVITNPNLAAWHEPGHSYGQEYMAILHAVIINLTHSDTGAAELSRWFEQRMAEHGSIDDLEGMALYLRVLEALLDIDSRVLTPEFDQHYLATLPACNAPRMTALPQADRERLENEATGHGVLVLPFLYPGHQPAAGNHRSVVLTNAGAGTYRELPPVLPDERLALMHRYLDALQRLVAGFPALQRRWQERLAASGQAAFWAEVSERHRCHTRLLFEGRFEAPAPTFPAEGPSSPTLADALPNAVPIRELRERLERELSLLARLRQGAASSRGPAPAHLPSPWARWWRGLWRRAPGTPLRPGLPGKALPSDFNPAQYLALNADVARTGVDAATHYTQFGRAEGRRYRL